MNRPIDVGVPVGDGQYVSPVEYLLMLGFLVHEAQLAPADVRFAARLTLRSILSAAAATGFHGGDLLETLMASHEKSARVVELAAQAIDAVGDIDAFLQILRGTGIPMEGEL